LQKKYKKKSIEEIKQEVDSLVKATENQIEKCFDTPEDIKEYLSFMSNFYNYSFNNIVLIQNQFSGAIAVGSYAFWKQKCFQVNKGEKGIKILVPNKTGEKFLNEQKEVKLLKDATPEEKEKVEKGILKYIKPRTYFSQGYVFDISQTNAKMNDLPKIFPNRWIEGDVVNYKSFFEAMENVADSIGVKIVEPHHELGMAKGVSYPLTKEVALNPRNSELQNVKTLIHELAHAKLHTIDKFNEYTTNEKEFQAELTAYTVCSHFHLDTSEYSFRYLKAWTKNAKFEDKKKLLNEVQETSLDFIKIIEDHFNKYKELEVENMSEEKKEITQKQLNELITKGETIDLSNCFLYKLTIEGNFKNANITNSRIYDCKIKNAYFENCNFESSNISGDFDNVILKNCSLSNAGLYNIKFKDTLLDNISLEDAVLKNISTVKDTVTFKDVDFLNTKMNGVYIQGSKVERSKNTNTIYITMGGATTEEVEKHKILILNTLDNKKEDLMNFYIIKDISKWINGCSNSFVRYDNLELAVDTFKELKKDTSKSTSLALGVGIGDSDLDILHLKNNKNYLITDFTNVDKYINNEKFIQSLNYINTEIGFDTVTIHENNSSKDVSFKKWENSYFEAEEKSNITFYVAECMEFDSLGEYYENIKTFDEAIEIYNSIPSSRLNGCKGIGFNLNANCLHDGKFELYSNGNVDEEIINSISDFRNNKFIQEAIIKAKEFKEIDQKRENSNTFSLGL